MTGHVRESPAGPGAEFRWLPPQPFLKERNEPTAGFLSRTATFLGRAVWPFGEPFEQTLESGHAFTQVGYIAADFCDGRAGGILAGDDE